MRGPGCLYSKKKRAALAAPGLIQGSALPSQAAEDAFAVSSAFHGAAPKLPSRHHKE